MNQPSAPPPPPQLARLNPFTTAGLCVYFLMMAFVAVWMLQGNLSAGDMMWATIIICSTTAVVLYLTGQENRRDREMFVRETRRDAIRDRNMREEIRKLKDEFGASAEERERIQASQELIVEMLGVLIREIQLQNAERAGYASGFVTASDADLNEKWGAKVRMLYPHQVKDDPGRGGRS